jgi:gamma-glutamylcyclotransferase
MDAHYDKVMKARAGLAAAPPRLYFAYSTVLDARALADWKGEHGYESFALPDGEVAEALDVELVFDFPSRWWGGRVAGLADTPGATVFGRLFEVRGADWPILEHKEGAVTGMSIEREVRVRRADGSLATARAFTTNPERARHDGPVSVRFVEALVRGAEQAGLPAPWIERLRSGAGAERGPS